MQSMPDASPGKWHLAHTSWFFETVVLQPHMSDYQAFDPRFGYLFNSYYEALGTRHPRPERGLLTRPSVDEVMAYREHVDQGIQRFLSTGAQAGACWQTTAQLILLGLHHEQQHQELLLTDALHLLSCNPLLPAYRPAEQPMLRLAEPVPGPVRFIDRPGGEAHVGHEADGFAFDNETPRHRVLLGAHAIADRLVTCGEFTDFMEDGGYRRPELWLSDGWGAVRAQGWQAPSYWLAPGDPRAPAEHWQVFGLNGVRPVVRSAPVSQLSFYEARSVCRMGWRTTADRI